MVGSLPPAPHSFPPSVPRLAWGGKSLSLKDSQVAPPVRLCSRQESGALGRQDCALKPGPPRMEMACLGSICSILRPCSDVPNCWRRHLWCVFEVILPFPPKPGPATHTHVHTHVHRCMHVPTNMCVHTCMYTHAPPMCTHTHNPPAPCS